MTNQPNKSAINIDQLKRSLSTLRSLAWMVGAGSPGNRELWAAIAAMMVLGVEVGVNLESCEWTLIDADAVGDALLSAPGGLRLCCVETGTTAWWACRAAAEMVEVAEIRVRNDKSTK